MSSWRLILLSSATRKVKGYFRARLRSKVWAFFVDARLVGELCAWCERLLRRDEDAGSKGVVAFGNVLLGLVVTEGESLDCGVLRRSDDLTSRPCWSRSGGRSRDARVGVGVPAGEVPLLCVSDGVIGTFISKCVPFWGPVVCDLTQTRSPPILRANPLATSKPNPRPSFCLVRESSSREYGLKRYGKKSCLIPWPVSSMLITMNRDLGLRVAESLIVP